MLSSLLNGCWKAGRKSRLLAFLVSATHSLTDFLDAGGEELKPVVCCIAVLVPHNVIPDLLVIKENLTGIASEYLNLDVQLYCRKPVKFVDCLFLHLIYITLEILRKEW